MTSSSGSSGAVEGVLEVLRGGPGRAASRHACATEELSVEDGIGVVGKGREAGQAGVDETHAAWTTPGPARFRHLSGPAPGTADAANRDRRGWALAYARAVSLSPEQQRSIDGLVAQVNVDNVLQVARLLRRQADDIERTLVERAWQLRVVPCGNDPVSRDAQELFQAKIDQIIDVHWAHWEELQAAVDALRHSADRYRFTEDELEFAFGKVPAES